MFLAHPDVPVQRLQRFADDEWRLLPAPFAVEPFDELGVKPALVLTLSLATVGVGRNFGASGAFLVSDVGRDIVSGSGSATITAYVDPNNVTCEIKSAFVGISIASGDWTITGSPLTTCAVSAVGPIGVVVTATLGAGGWRATGEVGKYIKVNGGLVKITGYTSSTVVNGTVQQVLTSTTAAISNSWTLNGAIWGGTNGFPRAVTLYEQRLLLAGSPGHPQHLLGSRIGDVLDFEIGTADDAAFSRELTTDQIGPPGIGTPPGAANACHRQRANAGLDRTPVRARRAPVLRRLLNPPPTALTGKFL